MFLTHIRAAGLVLQQCMESFLLQSQDAQSSPEKRRIVASGCWCCFSPSVPRRFPVPEPVPAGDAKSSKSTGFGRSRRNGPAIPAADRREHPKPRRSSKEPSRDKSCLGRGQVPLLPWCPHHWHKEVPAAPGADGSCPCRNAKTCGETKLRVRDRALQHNLALLRAPEHIPWSRAARDAQTQHPGGAKLREPAGFPCCCCWAEGLATLVTTAPGSTGHFPDQDWSHWLLAHGFLFGSTRAQG